MLYVSKSNQKKTQPKGFGKQHARIWYDARAHAPTQQQHNATGAENSKRRQQQQKQQQQQQQTSTRSSKGPARRQQRLAGSDR
jgi:hypothetical protein